LLASACFGDVGGLSKSSGGEQAGDQGGNDFVHDVIPFGVLLE
jgi:hypothetical protein